MYLTPQGKKTNLVLRQCPNCANEGIGSSLEGEAARVKQEPKR